jgi:TusA-related sulfurtransferase
MAKVVDSIGFYCPEPVFRARKAMEEANVGETIEIYADDPASESDIPVLVKKLGQELVNIEKNEAIFKFVVKVVRKVK